MIAQVRGSARQDITKDGLCLCRSARRCLFCPMQRDAVVGVLVDSRGCLKEAHMRGVACPLQRKGGQQGLRLDFISLCGAG